MSIDDGPVNDVIAVKPAVADQNDPTQQLEDIGDTEDHLAKRRKQVKKRSYDAVHCVEMHEKFGTPQLRTVRAMRSGKNVPWTHEEDVPWLVTYVAEELATGGVGPIIHADGAMEEECQQNNHGADSGWRRSCGA